MEVRRYRVYGRVQGVGFRHYVWRRLSGLGLDGWVRNRRDGTVEALVRADACIQTEVEEILRRGPRFSRVERLESSIESGVEPGMGFEVRSTL